MVDFADKPGRFERHLMRKQGNVLFQSPEYTDANILEARARDDNEILDFQVRLRELFNEGANLKPQEDSDVILKLKEKLDSAYEEACVLGNDQSVLKEAIQSLTEIIMKAVRGGAETDPKAMQELLEEDQARRMHYALLEHALVADLLHPQSTIDEHELPLCILCADEEAMLAAFALFDGPQQQDICEQIQQQLAALPDEHRNFWLARLQSLEQQIVPAALN